MARITQFGLIYMHGGRLVMEDFVYVLGKEDDGKHVGAVLVEEAIRVMQGELEILRKEIAAAAIPPSRMAH